jgi:hypothetical protein
MPAHQARQGDGLQRAARGNEERREDRAVDRQVGKKAGGEDRRPQAPAADQQRG